MGSVLGVIFGNVAGFFIQLALGVPTPIAVIVTVVLIVVGIYLIPGD